MTPEEKTLKILAEEEVFYCNGCLKGYFMEDCKKSLPIMTIQNELYRHLNCPECGGYLASVKIQ